MKIAHGVHMLEIRSIVMGAPSVIYPTLVFDSEGNHILIDTGFPGQLQLLREALSEVGADLNQLGQIVLTHQDIDHIGNAAAIKRERPSVRVMAYGEEAPYIQGDRLPVKVARLEAQWEGLSDEMRTVYGKLKAGFESCRVGVDRMLTDGETLPELGGIQVVATPGHTPGHICLYLKNSKTLVAGDALMVEDGELVRTAPFTNDDAVLYGESLKKLAEYEIDNVICYHGGLVRGEAGKRIQALIERNNP